MRPLQSEVEQRGARIFEIVDQHPESLFSKAGFYQRMMALSMRDEQFKAQLFRFVDVLPSLRKSGDIVEHLDEYFADMRNGFTAFIHTGVRLARIVPWVSGPVLRWNVSGMARQFIAGKNPNDLMKTLRKRRAQKYDARTFQNDLHRRGVQGLAACRHRHPGVFAGFRSRLTTSDRLGARTRHAFRGPIGERRVLGLRNNKIAPERLGLSGLFPEA